MKIKKEIRCWNEYMKYCRPRMDLDHCGSCKNYLEVRIYTKIENEGVDIIDNNGNRYRNKRIEC